MHLNIQSLKPKIDLLEVEAQPYDILVFTETWLNSNIPDKDLYIPNFNLPFRCDRKDRIGGGVTIYVRDRLHAVVCHNLSVNGLEALWVEIRLSQRKLLVGGIYRPPDSNNNYWLLLEQSIDQAFNHLCDNILVTGDFNINIEASPSNKMSRLISSYNAEQLINSPTNFTEHSRSLIDLMFIKNPRHVISSFVADPFVPNLIRFHCPIVTVLKFSKPKHVNFKRRIWLYERGDYNEYRRILSSTNWNEHLSHDNIDIAANIIAETILSAASHSIPNKLVTIRPTDIPWINNSIRRMIRKRNKLHKKAKSSNTTTNWANFRQSRNDTTKLIRQTKATYQQKLIDKANARDTPVKEWYKIAKKLNNKHTSTTIPPLADNGTEASSDHDKAELLNTYFCNQASLDDRNHVLPPVANTMLPTLSDIILTVQDVKDAISNIDSSKASGPDLISPRLIREGADALATPLSIYFNKLLSISTFPSPWKMTNVTPIFKKSDPSKPSNYRPISLLSCIVKLMERCVHNYLYNFVIGNGLITPSQSGFIKGDSTINQLTFLYNDICQALDEGKEVRVVFCDISKAFDRVWHRGLLHKLASLGIHGNLLNWFSSYLSQRRQRVVISSTSSSWSSVNAGVPQGSILGPLLFLVYINDIVKDIQAKIRLFADDTSLYIIVDDPISSATILNEDLRTIHTWSKDWLVTFNPSKTESMLFSRKRIKRPHPNLTMDNVVVDQVSTHKHLGLTLSDDAKWSSHINTTVNKAWQRIGTLRSLKYILNRKSLERMYFSFIRPVLEYGDTVWDNCTIQLKNEIESIQNEAARIVSGATKLCNIKSLLNELKWDTLAARRKKHRLTLLYKMESSISPAYLTDLIPTQAQRYQLRNASDIPLIHTRTQTYSSSFLPLTIKDWNTLPTDIRNSNTIGSFKANLNKNTTAPSPLYNIGNRRNQILHTRLRLGCSSLNHDLHRKNIVESPVCECGEIESTNHYLLQCHHYIPFRQRFLVNLPCALTVNNLLFGDEHLPFEQNSIIFLRVQSYIEATKRFNT